MESFSFNALFTKVQIPKTGISIDYGKKLAFFGSCFAQNISKKFLDLKFNVQVNPFGTVYNPLSIERVISVIAENKIYSEQDAFLDSEKWTCWDTHSALSRNSRQEFIENLNQTIIEAHDFLSKTDTVFITLGTAFVYILKETGEVVTNCHKQNASLFDRKLISVEQAINSLNGILDKLQKINPNVNVIFTVSPLRHLKDGAHGNSLSKSTLLLAANQVVSDNSHVASYFPSYEIVMDELRDYRFYDSDMIHLTDLAEDIIFDRIKSAYFSEKFAEDIKQVENFMKAVHHRVVNSDSSQNKDFTDKHIARAEFLMKQFPGLDLSEEIEYFKSIKSI